MRRRPKRKPARVRNRCRSNSTGRSNITIANYHGYRVTRSRAPFPAAVRLYHSGDIHFRNVHINAESGYPICDDNGCGTFLRVSKFPYENAIQDVTHHLEVREREFAVLDIPANPPCPRHADASAVLAPGAKVEKLEDGFFSISGAAVDASGKLYFVDHHQQRIYGWSAAEGLTIERDNPLDPVNLAFDKAGDLLVLSSAGPEGTVYSFRPGSPEDQITVLAPQASAPHPGAAAILPVNYWNNGEFRDQLDFNTLTYTDAGRNVCRRCVDAQGEGIRLAGRQRLPARRSRLPAGPSGLHRLALLRQSGHLWLHQRASRPAGLCQQRIGRSHLQRDASAPTAR